MSRKKTLGKCVVSWCSRPAVAHYLCKTHYRRWRRENHEPINFKDNDIIGLVASAHKILANYAELATAKHDQNKHKDPFQECQVGSCGTFHESESLLSSAPKEAEDNE